MIKLHLDIARRLPGAKQSGKNIRLPCPVHQPGRKQGDSLSVANGLNGPVWHCHAGCDPKEVRDALIAIGVLERTPQPQPAYQDTAAQQDAWMRDVWRRGSRIDKPILDYLKLRGIPNDVAIEAGRNGKVLRQHKQGMGWVMLAQITNNMGDMVGLHRTFIDADGAVTQRRCHGRIKGAAIRLFSDKPRIVMKREGRQIFSHLAIAEGIETAMSYRVLRPSDIVWSLMSGAGISTFEAPPQIEQITVAADFDGTSITAFEKLGRRLKTDVICTLSLPDMYGDDWNDVVRRQERTQQRHR